MRGSMGKPAVAGMAASENAAAAANQLSPDTAAETRSNLESSAGMSDRMSSCNSDYAPSSNSGNSSSGNSGNFSDH